MLRIKPLCEKVTCADGATVSIQASQYHYATPRNDEGPYVCVEAGYPSVAPPTSWREYADGGEDCDLKDTVFGYMPVSLVREFIDDHGGMVSGELPKFATGQ